MADIYSFSHVFLIFQLCQVKSFLRNYLLFDESAVKNASDLLKCYWLLWLAVASIFFSFSQRSLNATASLLTAGEETASSA